MLSGLDMQVGKLIKPVLQVALKTVCLVADDRYM